MRTKTIIATGIAGWLGGLGTMVLSGSCDVEEDGQLDQRFYECMDASDMQDPDMPLTSKPRAIEPDREFPLRWKPDDGDPPPPRERGDSSSAPPTSCDPLRHPSVFVYVVKEMDDYLQPVPVDAVWYEHEGRVEEARCAGGQTERGCEQWFAGFEMTGEITVSTEYCDTVVDQSVLVRKADDACHVDTQFMILTVSTRGCVATPSAPPPPSDPEHAASEALSGPPA